MNHQGLSGTWPQAAPRSPVARKTQARTARTTTDVVRGSTPAAIARTQVQRSPGISSSLQRIRAFVKGLSYQSHPFALAQLVQGPTRYAKPTVHISQRAVLPQPVPGELSGWMPCSGDVLAALVGGRTRKRSPWMSLTCMSHQKTLAQTQ
jgi:hypothetical protein